MAIPQTAIVAISGAVLVGSYVVDPSTLPYAVAGVAATLAGAFFTGTFSARSKCRGDTG